MRITERVVIGILTTAVLTSAILLALDAYYAKQEASRLKTLSKAQAGDSEPSGGSDNADAKPSIGTKEQQLVYQTQENPVQDSLSQHSAQPGQQGGQDGQATAGTGNQNAQSAPDADAASHSADGQNMPPDVGAGSQNIPPDANTGSQNVPPDANTGSQNVPPDANTGSQNGTHTTDAGSQNGKSGSSAKSKGGQTDSAPSQTEGKQTGSDPSQSKGSDKPGKKDAKDTDSSPKETSFQKVTEDYFSDALFIGDSRTVGMQQSNLLPNATYYAKTGIGIGDMLSQRIVCEGGTMISVADALGRHSFGKVYIMVGINDMSRGDVDWFIGQYAEILEAVCQTQPDAIVYIQGNIPMSYGTQDMGGTLNNQNLTLRNEASRTLADSETIFYLDVDEVYEDGNGHLAQMYTRDGLHVSTRYYPLWVDYLEHHAIVR